MEHPEPFEMEELYTINNLETLKVLSDTFRLRILELMCNKPTTVKQVAELLEVPPKKLYYHVNLMEEHDLIVVVNTNLVSGIIEKWYQSRAKSFGVESSLLLNVDSPDNPLDDMVSAILDATRSDILRAARQGQIPPEQGDTQSRMMYLERRIPMLDNEERAEFVSQLKDLVEKFAKHDKNFDDPQRSPYGLTIAFYPMASPEAEPANDEEHDEQ